MSKRLMGLVAALSLGAASVAASAPAAEPLAPDLEGIWGAIAYSTADGNYGFTWGAPNSEDAKHEASIHCEHADGQACEVVSVFRNYRDEGDEDDHAFPYQHCAALAKGEAPAVWGVAAAERRAEAEDQALKICKADGGACKIVEWVCT